MSFIQTLSNRELNIAGTLLLDVIVAVYYFISLSCLPGGWNAEPKLVAPVVIKTIVIAIISATVVFTLINWRKGEEAKDERDYRFESKANSVAYFVLSLCLIVIIGHIAINALIAQNAAHPSIFESALTPSVIVHILLIALIVASVCKAFTQLFLYRRNAF